MNRVFRLFSRCAALLVVLHQYNGIAFATNSTDLDLGSLLETDLTVFSATKLELSIAQSPSVVAVITREELRLFNDQTIVDALSRIPGLYVNQDYVFKDVGVRGISGDFKGASRLLKFLVDGKPVGIRTDTTNLVGPEFIPLEVVERIEIIRGPVSALYGANAFLGIVNVITRKPSQTPRLWFSSFVQSFGELKDHNLGYGVSLGIERAIGGWSFLFSASYRDLDRSGLSAPCGTVYDGDCEVHRGRVNTTSVFDMVSFEDHERPWSVLAKIGANLGDIFGASSQNLGEVELFFLHQSLASSANFTDASVLQYSYYEEDTVPVTERTPISNSENKIGIVNSVFRGIYDLSLREDAIRIHAGFTYAFGGPSHQEQPRNQRVTDRQGNRLERQQSRFEGLDLVLEIQWVLFEELLHISKNIDGLTLIKDLTLVLGVDLTIDKLSYARNSFVIPTEFAVSNLENTGVFTQFTGSFFNRRLSLTAGFRYDSHLGAQLTEFQIASSATEPKLCDGRVCYSSFNYRFGGTFELLKDFGYVRGMSLINHSYIKVLYGTAFKAPAPIFLYEYGYLEERPVSANASLSPQEVKSLEFVFALELLEQRIDLKAVFYQNILYDRVVFSEIDTEILAINSGATINTVGQEFIAQFNLDPLNIRLSIANQHSVRDFPSIAQVGIRKTAAFPDITGLLSISWFLQPLKMHITGVANYVGERIGSPLQGRGDIPQNRYNLSSYTLLHLFLRTEPLALLDKALPTQFWFSIKNLLNSRYEFPGFQPYYGVDIPGVPRVIAIGFTQTL